MPILKYRRILRLIFWVPIHIVWALLSSCSIQHSRLTPSDPLEEQLVKARSSMALRIYLMSISIRVNLHKMEENQFLKGVRVSVVSMNNSG